MKVKIQTKITLKEKEKTSWKTWKRKFIDSYIKLNIYFTYFYFKSLLLFYL